MWNTSIVLFIGEKETGLVRSYRESPRCSANQVPLFSFTVKMVPEKDDIIRNGECRCSTCECLLTCAPTNQGVHIGASILNPSWPIRPSALLRGAYLDNQPIYFAASIISDCEAASLRDLYLKQLIENLGSDRVHQYGACGDRELPPPPLDTAFETLSKYKL